MPETLLQQLEKSGIRYSNKFVGNLIRQQRAKYGNVGNTAKKLIFFMTKKIVLKGAYNFIAINKSRGRNSSYELDDIVIELYFTFSECMNNFNPDLNKNFYLYFNKAVSRRISRMANYAKYTPNVYIDSLDKPLNNDGFTLMDVLDDKLALDSTEDTMLRIDLGLMGIKDESIEDVFRFDSHPESKNLKRIIKLSYGNT